MAQFPADAAQNELARLETIEAKMLTLPQVDVPLRHSFAPGVYMRQVLMPAGSLILGHCHKTEHFNIVLTGKALVLIDGQTYAIEAPYAFKSGVNVRKLLYIVEDMVWATIHPTDETDLGKLEELLIDKSQTYLEHEKLKGLEQFQATIEQIERGKE